MSPMTCSKVTLNRLYWPGCAMQNYNHSVGKLLSCRLVPTTNWSEVENACPGLPTNGAFATFRLPYFSRLLQSRQDTFLNSSESAVQRQHTDIRFTAKNSIIKLQDDDKCVTSWFCLGLDPVTLPVSDSIANCIYTYAHIHMQIYF